MSKKEFKSKYIYGPVFSWRLRRSLGIDPIAQKRKVCCFDCAYCQVGRRKPALIKRKTFVKTEKIINEIRVLPKARIDYITFSGSGEPTLAANLGSLIKAVKEIRKEPVAVITNSALIGRKDVRTELAQADLVMAKLDASNNDVLRRVNNPRRTLTIQKIVSGLKKLRRCYKGVLALQIMFVKENQDMAIDIAVLAKSIRPDRIYINTPLRPSQCRPLTKTKILQIKQVFESQGLNVACVYDKRNKNVRALNSYQTQRIRGLQP